MASLRVDNGATMSPLIEDVSGEAWQNVQNASAGPNWDWDKPFWGDGATFQVLYKIGTAAAALSATIVDKVGASGSAKSLKLTIISKPHGDTQMPLLINPTVDPQEFYVRYYCWLPLNLATIISGGAGYLVMGPEWKTPNDRRAICNITLNGTTPRFNLTLDRNTNGNLAAETVYDVQNTTVDVPLDQWFSWEYYCKRGGTGVGRIWTKCNGVVVNDASMSNMGVNNEAMNRLFFLQCYANAAVDIYIDGLEVWEVTPQAAPTRLWFDSVANGALTTFLGSNVRPAGAEAAFEQNIAVTSPEVQLQQYVSGRVVDPFTLSGTMTFSLVGNDPNNGGCAYRAKVYKRTAAGVETLIGTIDAPSAITSTYARRTWSGTPTSTAFATDDRIVARIFVMKFGGGNLTGGYITHSYGGRRTLNGGYAQISETVGFKRE